MNNIIFIVLFLVFPMTKAMSSDLALSKNSNSSSNSNQPAQIEASASCQIEFDLATRYWEMAVSHSKLASATSSMSINAKGYPFQIDLSPSFHKVAELFLNATNKCLKRAQERRSSIKIIMDSCLEMNQPNVSSKIATIEQHIQFMLNQYQIAQDALAHIDLHIFPSYQFVNTTLYGDVNRAKSNMSIALSRLAVIEGELSSVYNQAIRTPEGNRSALALQNQSIHRMNQAYAWLTGLVAPTPLPILNQINNESSSAIVSSLLPTNLNNNILNEHALDISPEEENKLFYESGKALWHVTFSIIKYNTEDLGTSYDEGLHSLYEVAIEDKYIKNYALSSKTLIELHYNYLCDNKRQDEAKSVHIRHILLLKDPTAEEMRAVVTYFLIKNWEDSSSSEVATYQNLASKYCIRLFKEKTAEIEDEDYCNMAIISCFFEKDPKKALYYHEAITKKNGIIAPYWIAIAFAYHATGDKKSSYNCFLEARKADPHYNWSRHPNFLALFFDGMFSLNSSGLLSNKKMKELMANFSQIAISDLKANSSQKGKAPKYDEKDLRQWVRTQVLKQKFNHVRSLYQDVSKLFIEADNFLATQSKKMLEHKTSIQNQMIQLMNLYKNTPSPSPADMEIFDKSYFSIIKDIEEYTTAFYVQKNQRVLQKKSGLYAASSTTTTTTTNSSMSTTSSTNLKNEVVAQHHARLEEQEKKASLTEQQRREREKSRQEKHMQYEEEQAEKLLENDHENTEDLSESLLGTYLPTSASELNQTQRETLLKVLQWKYELSEHDLEIASVILGSKAQELKALVLLSFFTKLKARAVYGGNHVKILGEGYELTIPASFNTKDGTYHGILKQACKVLVEVIGASFTIGDLRDAQSL